MRRWLLTAGILAIPAAVLLFTGSWAAQAELGSIGARPAYPRENNKRSENIFIHQLDPGDSVDDGVRIYNYTKEPRVVEVKAVDSVLASDGSFSCRQAAEKKRDIGAWTKLETEKVTIKPEGNVLVPFTVAVPKSASPGEHGGCITVQDTKNFASTTGGGVQLGFRTAIRMAITVGGDIIKSLGIQKIDIKRVSNGNYTVSPIAKNEGNVSLDVTARAQLRSVFGQETDIKKAEYPIIAGASTGWAFEFDRPFWGGFYKAYTSLSYDADPDSGLGEATGESKRISKQSGYFFMLPAPQAIAIELAVLLVPLLILGIFLWRKRRARRAPRATTPAEQKASWLPYTVTAGDSLVSLAETYNVSWKKLAKKNKIKAPYLLTPGGTILVPQKLAAPTATIDEPVESKPVPTTTPIAQDTPVPRSAPIYQQPFHEEQPAPVQSPAPSAVPVPAQPAQTYSGWTSPRESSYPASQQSQPQVVPTQFPEYYHSHQPGQYEVPQTGHQGWAAPMQDNSGYISDSSLVPELRTLWDDSSEAEAQKPAKKKPAVKKASKAKRPKKEK